MSRYTDVWRGEATIDVNHAASYYLRESGIELARRFLRAVDAAVLRAAERPGAGSPRYGVVLGIDGLRTVQVQRFPYLIFYIVEHDRIDVWRVLHAQRDLAAELSEDDSD